MEWSGVDQFLKDYPGMSLRPRLDNNLRLAGKFAFVARLPNGDTITDYYKLEMNIPSQFPNKLPQIREVRNKIPRDGNHHINPDDTLCLGSPIRILKLMNGEANLTRFSERCLVPFLAVISLKLKKGGGFLFGELAHGTKGLIDDYCELFGVNTKEQVITVLNLLGMKRRVANKKSCPCQCGQRLGKCSFRKKIKQYYSLAPRAWFRLQAREIAEGH